MLEPQPYRIRCSRRRGGTGKGNILILLVLPLRPAGKKGGREVLVAHPNPRSALKILCGQERRKQIGLLYLTCRCSLATGKLATSNMAGEIHQSRHLAPITTPAGALKAVQMARARSKRLQRAPKEREESARLEHKQQPSWDPSW